ncbi:MAG: CoA pyrophosphatase [Candidatus Eisenbacteria bacterium]|nr:CoA pyrophosphatase [Candidatus Eisenbacteria bacterium]
MSSDKLSDTIRERIRSQPAPERPDAYDHLRQAVSFFLLVDRDETRALLVKKKETPGYTWSGQVGMVGGMIEEEDASDLETAFREFEEELRIDRSALEVFGDLGYFPSRIADALLHVYVARWNGEGTPVPDPREIDDLVEVPFSELARLHEKRGLAGGRPDPEGRGPHYPVGHPRKGPLVIWGVTARTIHALLELIR